MIIDDEYLFNEAWRVITTEKTIDSIPQSFNNKDIEVNDLEKEIRRLLCEHLLISPGHDALGCLALMRLIKDAERIGDYSKDIFKAGILHGRTIIDIRYYDRIVPIQQKISGDFPVLVKMIEDSDVKLAEGILSNYESIKHECDKIFDELFGQELSAKEAVVTAILLKYFERVNSHINNITSGIINPLN
jgi:phosphate uptake regulator